MIDPFSQIKGEYNTILDDADSASSNYFFPFQSFTGCTQGNVSQSDK